MWDEKLTFSGHATQNIQNALGRLIKGLYKVRIWLPEPPLSSSLSKLLLIQSFNPAIPVNGNSILSSIWVSSFRYVANFLPLDQLWRILTCGTAHKDNQIQIGVIFLLDWDQKLWCSPVIIFFKDLSNDMSFDRALP